MVDLAFSTSRRTALAAIGVGAAAAAVLDTGPAVAAPPTASLADLIRRLAAAPRRRDFTTVPFLVDRPEQWDHEASAELVAYRGGPKQVWENSDLGAAWINLMREAMNGQVFAHGHTDFLPVSATHGSAHLPLFNQAMWDKYRLADRTGGIAAQNHYVEEKPGVAPADDRHDIGGFYGLAGSNIVSLQRRGAVFVGCHDTIHATARALHDKSPGTSADMIAADLTNNLIPGVVLVPSVVAYLAELQSAGFGYAKGA
jgi:hypothetical protein